MSPSKAPLLLLLSLLPAACDLGSTGPGDDRTGSFTATVTGDLQEELSGEALFGETTDASTGERAWALILASETDPTDYVGFVRFDSRPGTGVFSLADGGVADIETTGEIGAILGITQGDTTAFMASTGGTLTITGSSGSSMEGSFVMAAVGDIVVPPDATEGTVAVSGSFQAVVGEVRSLPDR